MTKQRTATPRKGQPAAVAPQAPADTPKPASSIDKGMSKAARPEETTAYADALRALAADFHSAAVRERDLSAPPPSFPEIMERMTWQDEAGQLVVRAHRAGLLELPGLPELVAWLDGGDLPPFTPGADKARPAADGYTLRVNVLSKGEILRCPSNLWLSVVGRAEIPARLVDDELRAVPVFVGGLLADDPRMRSDRLFKYSMETRGADAEGYARLVRAAAKDCDAAACRVLAEKIELAAPAEAPDAPPTVPQADAPAIPNDLVPLKAVVAKLHVGRTTLRRWIEDHTLTSYQKRPGAKHWVSEAAVYRLVGTPNSPHSPN